MVQSITRQIDEAPEPEPQDTEITLGTGKMLLLFFGLVALCGVFFGIGFNVGRNSARTVAVTTDQSLTATQATTSRPAGNKPSTSQPEDELSFSKPAPQNPAPNAIGTTTANPQMANPQFATPAAPASAPNPQAIAEPPAPAKDPSSPPLTNTSNYFVQVAAVTNRADAEALVDALKQKQYAAFIANASPDKLFHVQVGPFEDIKDAELTRGKLVGDGYNPILKR